MTCLQAALDYAARGWPVLPLRGKIPLTPHGVKDATTEEATIRYWFGKWPTANVGVACGTVSGVTVVDVDQRSGGLETLATLDLPPTLTVKTGGGGLHLYYLRPAAPLTGGKGRFGPGIDCQHDGRYVVAPPSVHPETAQVYAWEDAEREIVAFPDLLLEVAAGKERAALPVAAMTTPLAPIPDVVDRARRYLATMRPSVSGQGGHDALFRAACAMMNGFGLDKGTARGLLDEYNATASPPWRPKDIAHKLDDAEKDGTYGGRQRGCLLAERAEVVRVSPVVVEARARRAAQEAQAIPEVCLRPPGLVGEVMRYVEACAVHPAPVLSLTAALSTVATACGRKYRTRSGVRPVLHVVAVAKSGVGKEVGRQCAISLLRAAGLGARVGVDEVSSAAAIATLLKESPTRLLMLDELGRLLESYSSKTAASFERQIVTALVRLWSSADGTYLGKAMANQKLTGTAIECPHLHVYGTTTPGSFHRALRGADVVDGVINRLLILPVDHGQEREREPTASRGEPPEPLVAQIKTLAAGPPGIGDLACADMGACAEVTASDAARALDADVGEYVRGALEGAEHPEQWVRAREQTWRLALVLAVGCGSLAIEVDHLSWAWELVRWSVRRTVEVVRLHVAESPEDAARQAILRLLEERGQATRSQITRALWRTDRRTREAALATLVDAGAVALAQVAGSQVYCPAEAAP